MDNPLLQALAFAGQMQPGQIPADQGPQNISATPPAPNPAPQGFPEPPEYLQGIPGVGLSTPLRRIGPTGEIEKTPGGHLKRALSDALYGLSAAMRGGIGAGIEAATPRGQEQQLLSERSAATEQRAKELSEFYTSTGRFYAGAGAYGRSQAANEHAAAYAGAMGARIAALNAQAGNKNFISVRQADGSQRIYDIKKGAFADGLGQTGGGAILGHIDPEVAAYNGIDLNTLAPEGVPLKFVKMANDSYNAQFNRPVPTMEGEIVTTKAGKPIAKVGTAPSAVQAGISGGRLGIEKSKFDLAFQQFAAQYRPDLLTPDVQKAMDLPTDEDGNVIPLKSPRAPIALTKGTVAQAKVVNALLDTTITKLQDPAIQAELGPFRGRINEIMAGKIGKDVLGEKAYNDFAFLRTLESFDRTGMIKLHFGSRGGTQLYDTFKGMLDTGKMDAPTMLSSLSAMKTVADKYASEMPTTRTVTKAKNNATPPIPEGATATGPGGHKIQMKGGRWVDAATGQPIQ